MYNAVDGIEICLSKNDINSVVLVDTTRHEVCTCRVNTARWHRGHYGRDICIFIS